MGIRVGKCGAAACGECGVRALFEKVRPHEKSAASAAKIAKKLIKFYVI